MSKSFRVFLILITLTMAGLWGSLAYGTSQKGLGFELGVGYPQYSLSDSTQNGKYSGVSVQGNMLFPLLSSGAFSMDLDFVYRYTSLENNSSNSTLSEWAHLNSYGAGFRFNYSYLFAGVDYLSVQAKHVRSGTSNLIFEYEYNPIQWHAGLALPVSPVTSVIAGYSNMSKTNFDVQGSSFTANEEIFWLRFQIDFGVSFFNLLKPEESFSTTRGSFFVNP